MVADRYRPTQSSKWPIAIASEMPKRLLPAAGRTRRRRQSTVALPLLQQQAHDVAVQSKRRRQTHAAQLWSVWRGRAYAERRLFIGNDARNRRVPVQNGD